MRGSGWCPWIAGRTGIEAVQILKTLASNPAREETLSNEAEGEGEKRGGRLGNEL